MRRSLNLKSPSMSQLMLAMTIGIVLITAVSITVFVQHRTTRAMLDAEDRLARGLLSAVTLNVENEYRSMLYLEQRALNQRKAELKDMVAIAESLASIHYQAYRQGRISQTQAQAEALSHLRQLRYNQDYGYIWVSLLAEPPTILMHPTLPEVENYYGEDPRFYQALGGQRNLLEALADICRRQGEGYIVYNWAKPTPQGLVENQHKLSYVKLFKPWNWILGSGVYIDDIEAEARDRKAAIIKELQESLPQLKLGRNGYIFIFDGHKNMIVHPSLKGPIAAIKTAPANSARLMDAQMRAARQPGAVHEYVWDKPGHEGEFRFRKRTYVSYFKPFDWYIVASVYLDEVEQPASALSRSILSLTLLFCGLAVILALSAARWLTRPLRLLSQAALSIEENGLAGSHIPVSGPRETRNLGRLLNRMAASLQASGKALRDNEERYRSIFENSYDAIIIIQDERVIDCNRISLKLFGRERSGLIGQSPWDLSPAVQPDGRPSRQATLDYLGRAVQGEPQLFEWLCQRADGSPLHCEIILNRLDLGGQTYVHAILHDIGERKQAEAERKQSETRLRQAQKMEAIGTLAGGIAHDFNNILTGILGYGELALDEVDAGGKAADHLSELLRAAERAKTLVRQILTFSRQVESEVVAVKPHLIIKEALQLLRASIPATVSIEQDIDPATGTVMADPSQLHQVIMNLCTNAYAAMPEGGTLRVVLQNCLLREDDLNQYQGLSARPHVRLSVSDTGIGMDAGTLQHIFEPFFTTKPKGEGTGLGLSTVHGIVKSIQGDITVYSQPGLGTTFNVYIPTVAAEIETQPEKAAPCTGRGQTILLIDDEKPILNLGRLILEKLGYTVRAFDSPDQALQVLRDEAEIFDLIITDYAMPGMTGIQLARLAKAIRPELPIIMTSGFAPDSSEARLSASGITLLIEKPFNTARLAEAVCASLASRPGL